MKNAFIFIAMIYVWTIALPASAFTIDFLDYPQLDKSKSAVYLNLGIDNLSMKISYFSSAKRKKLTLNGPGYHEPAGGADGIGIGDDEIGNIRGKTERLFIQFGAGLDEAHFSPVDVLLSSVDITDLYFDDHGSGYNEIGFYDSSTRSGLNALGTEYAYFQQQDPKKRNTSISGTQGEYQLTLNRPASKIAFWAEEPASAWAHLFPELSSEKYRNNDFSVRGLSFTPLPVPEPSTALLLMTALLALAAACRRSFRTLSV